MALRLPAIERKEQVLDVALSVFASKGFHDTSMNDIAEAAGVRSEEHTSELQSH